MPSLRSSVTLITSGFASSGNLRSAQYSLSYAYKQSRDPLMKTAAEFTQYMYHQSRIPIAKMAFMVVQYAIKAPEEFVTDLIFPELIGLSWDTTMKPLFSTKIAEHTSGKETRTSFWDDPKFDFTLNYDYLPNREAGTTDLKKLMGFFMKCSGSFETFLFKAPDFHTVVNQQLLVGDGNIVEVPLIQDIDGFIMPVGYVDSSTLLVKQTQTQTIVADGTALLTLPFPYHATIALVKQGVTTITPTSSSPGANQYVFDSSTGTLQFNAARASQTFAVTYTAELREFTEFTILYPRTLVLETATPSGGIVVGSYEYYFTCRFLDDETDFAQFSDKLWNLQEINIRSVFE